MNISIHVIPAKAGIHTINQTGPPPCEGMTRSVALYVSLRRSELIIRRSAFYVRSLYDGYGLKNQHCIWWWAGEMTGFKGRFGGVVVEGFLGMEKAGRISVLPFDMSTQQGWAG